MEDFTKTCIYFHFQNINRTDTVDYQRLANLVKNRLDVSLVLNSISYPIGSTKKIVSEFDRYKINNLLIVSSTPGLITPYFQRILNSTQVNKIRTYSLRLEDYGINPLEKTEKLISIIQAKLYRMDYNDLATTNVKLKSKKTLIIGGGIAGIQAALEIANSGNQVILIEKKGTIGGHMAMFDKTFPTLDCAACILTPKMTDVGQHENIELHTLCEVIGLEGNSGDYHVKVLKKARRVDESKCIGCGTCSEKCPGTAPSEFDSGTTMRKAIYIPFPQAVPNKYLVDPESCTYIQKGKCRVCEKFCPVENCINLDEKDKQLEFHVGNIIVASGFKTFNPAQIQNYGYGRIPNVLTSLELERLINAAGPTGGNIRKRTQDKKGNWIFTDNSPEPRSFALIHCIGSRDVNHHPYCSRVCCMYSLKLAHLIKEKIPDAKIYEHFIDMRSFGKGYEEFYERIKNEGIDLIRGKAAKVEGFNEKIKIRSEDITAGKLLEYEVDMVILSVGLEPQEDSKNLAEILNLSTSPDGWLREEDHVFQTENSSIPGIHIAGACQGPKDIPDSVVQASAAASKVILSIMNNQIRQVNQYLSPESISAIASELAPSNSD